MYTSSLAGLKRKIHYMGSLVGLENMEECAGNLAAWGRGFNGIDL